MKSNSYESKDVEVYGDAEGIRKRPGMYIGDTADSHHLFIEATDNALDEIQLGYSEKAIINVDTKLNKYSVRDFGRGIPIGKTIYKDQISDTVHEVETIRLLFTKNHSGSKFSGSAYKKSRGLHGTGLKAINALSSYCMAQTFRDGKSVKIELSKGEVTSLEYLDTDEPNGVYIEYIPDPEIFDDPATSIDFIIDSCEVNKAFGSTLELYIDGELQELRYNDLYDLLPYDEDESEYFRTEFFVESDTTESIQIAIKYTNATNCIERGYTNTLYNSMGGSHIRFFESVYKEAWEKYMDKDFRPNDVLIGLRALVGVSISNEAMSFSSQTKEKLITKVKYFDQFREQLIEEIRKFFDSNEEIRKGLIKRFKEYRASQNKLMATKELADVIYVDKQTDGKIRRKSVVTKLKECSSKTRAGTSLMIAEGDSASGSLGPVRDVKYEALLPIRGKILNVSNILTDTKVKHPFNVCMENEEVRSIVNCAGTGIGIDCDANLSRYERYLIACFTGDTKLRMLDGTVKTFEELVEIETENPGGDYWVYSTDDKGKFVPGRGYNPRVTGETDKLAHVILDDGTEITCTPNHGFRLKDGSYREAKDLVNGDSLLAEYFRLKNGYEQISDTDDSRGWEYTYRKVIDNTDPSHQRGKTWQTHHKDHNKRNNNPDNLVWMTLSEHCSHHLTEYNVSEKHRDRVKELHEDGFYDYTYFGRNGYNESEAHRKAAARVGRMVGGKNITKYNKSEQHKETVRQMNKSPEIKLLQTRGKVLKVVSQLQFEDLEFTPENYYNVKMDVNKSAPKYENLLKYFDSYEEIYELAKTYNHKVQNVWIEYLDEPVKTYNITVDKYHNYLISNDDDTSGVIVKNCDSDFDGYNIAALLASIFINLLPDLVREGMVYVLQAPLYSYLSGKNKRVYTNDESEAKGKKGFFRYKGLGEMNPEDVKATILSKENQELVRLTYPDDIDEFNLAMTSSTMRFEMLKELGMIRFEDAYGEM